MIGLKIRRLTRIERETYDVLLPLCDGRKHQAHVILCALFMRGPNARVLSEALGQLQAVLYELAGLKVVCRKGTPAEPALARIGALIAQTSTLIQAAAPAAAVPQVVVVSRKAE